MCRRHICSIFLTSLLLTVGSVVGTRAQSDPSENAIQADSAEKEHSPKGALWRAAVLPGWGQFYNEQYLKIPVVYATLGGLTALAITFNEHYLTYRHAYLYQAYQELFERGEIDTHPYPQYESDHEALVQRIGSVSTDLLRRQRDNLRRNRDLTYIGIGIAWGLSIVDAYVSAHLADFDVGEDLSLRIKPTGHQLQVRFIFNR